MDGKGDGVEWSDSMGPDELREQAAKADAIAARMEAEARRFRAIADRLRERAGIGPSQ